MTSELPALSSGERRQLRQLGIADFPALIQRLGPQGWRAFLDFFSASIPNQNTKRAYLRAVWEFLERCEDSGIEELVHIEPFMVGAYVEHLGKPKDAGGLGLSKASVKLKLAAIRSFFDHLVVHQVLPKSPALSVRGPKLKVRKGKTPVLSLEDFQKLTEAIDTSTLVGKRDFAWLTVAFTSWCRVSAVTALRLKDYEHSGKRSFLHVEEKGGEVDRMPIHHKAQDALDELVAAAGLTDKDAPLFQSVDRSGAYTGRQLLRNKAWEMVRRRARQAGVPENICTHTFRASGITEFIRAGGRIERAQRRAHHADSRTTKLYDHSDDDVTLEDIELVQF